jgi:cell division protein FtsA
MCSSGARDVAIFGSPTGPRGRNGSSRLAGRPEHVAVLDLGAASAKCLIGRRAGGGGIEVLGVGKAPSKGLKAGAVVDMDGAEASIRAAVEEAERMAGATVNAVTVSFCGGHLASHGLYGETLLAEKPACDRDLRRALDGALQGFEEEGRVALHAIPLAWSIDAHRGVRDPRGMFGHALGVEVHVVSAGASPVRNMTLCIERARMSLRNVVATPYASGLSTLVEDETDLGVTLIDMGASTTSAAVFIEGALVHVDCAPIGGVHISNDLARGLSTPVAEAERIKRRFGSLIERPGDDDQVVECPELGADEGRIRAPRALVRDIVRARLEETLEIVRDRLASVGVLRAAGPRVVLTGGASQLEGAAIYAGEILGKRVRLARPAPLPGLPDGDDGPDMAAAIGLLRHALAGPREALDGPPKAAEELRPRQEMAGFKQAASWLRANF